MTESIFVTGAARGIGRAVARKFAAAGCLVGAVDVDRAALESLETEAVQRGWRVRPSAMDVTDIEGWHTALAKFAGDSGGRLDVLVNNAGLFAAGDFADIAPERHKRLVDVNVTGVLNGCHAAFPYLRDTAGARVLNMCSASAIYGQGELASYSATKFAVRGLTEALDLEWQQHDIAVLALWPLFVDTDMLAGVRTRSTEALGINLTADGVADAAWDALHRRSRVPKVHFPVGNQTKSVYYLSQISPPWLTRLINRRLLH